MTAIATLAALCTIAAGRPAAAATEPSASPPEAYALIAGSNHGGPGQDRLHYAEADARRVSEVLSEVGGYTSGGVRLLLDPNKRQLLAALAEVRERIAAGPDGGAGALFLFYYSGHARANALNLGAEEVELTQLRELLLTFPAKVKLVILDACQSGSFSKIKGARPAADFSFNSVSRLDTEGVAVMASSSATELSQESETLGASYFTHHLVVGLRGAADRNADGRISLAEAYHYAYNRTLLTTAETAVGSQHVTLETELRGKGEMVLSYPERARSQLELPAELAAEVLVHRRPDDSVIAEIRKAPGEPTRLGLPAGDYLAVIRRPGDIRRCELTLAAEQRLSLSAETCAKVEAGDVAPKGGSARTAYSLELGVGFGNGFHDRYTDRLADFGYQEHVGLVPLRYSLTAGRALGEYFELLLRFEPLDSGEWRRTLIAAGDEEKTQTYRWSTYAVDAQLRVQLPLFDGKLTPYAQGGIGLAWAGTSLDDQSKTFFGYFLGMGAGVQAMPWRHFGFWAELGYATAPVIENLSAELHDSGGFAMTTGLRAAF